MLWVMRGYGKTGYGQQRFDCITRTKLKFTSVDSPGFGLPGILFFAYRSTLNGRYVLDLKMQNCENELIRFFRSYIDKQKSFTNIQ